MVTKKRLDEAMTTIIDWFEQTNKTARPKFTMITATKKDGTKVTVHVGLRKEERFDILEDGSIVVYNEKEDK